MPPTRRRRIELAALLLLACGLTASAPGHSGRKEAEVGPGEVRMRVVAEALAWRGAPYRFGGHTKRGVDCSGFVHEVLAAAEAPGRLPRRSSDFLAFGSGVEGEVEPGDILLFGSEDAVDHVAIALSRDSFIHAASTGPRTGVIISSLAEESWKARLVSARRIEGGIEW